MNKRSLIIVSSLVVVALIASAIILARKPVDKSQIVSQEGKDEALPSAVTPSQTESAGVVSEENVPEPARSDEVVRSENIDVLNNSPEFDLRASLCKTASGKTYLKFEYYSEGTSVVKEVGADRISELEGLFDKREAGNAGDKDYRLTPVNLNAKNTKAYFTITGKVSEEQTTNTAIYSFNLKDGTVKKLFSEIGKYTELGLSKSFKYLAFSYYDSTLSSKYQESSLLQVVQCDSENFLVDGSRDQKRMLIGNNKDVKLIYDYVFSGWSSGSILKLKETAYPKEGTGEKKTREILYDVEKNLFLNPDGSVARVGEDASKLDPQAVKESEPVKTLRNFYTCISNGKYKEAYDLLDDRFRLNAFRLLGVEELSKKDIDVESFSVYGSLFQAARLESIVLEKVSGGTATVYFYQTFSMGEGEEVRQPLAAGLNKTDKGWKIASVSDGNINEKPFKQ